MITECTITNKIKNKNIALGGHCKTHKNKMSRLNLRRVGADVTYKEAVELMEQGKLVSQKVPFSKGVFAFKINDLEAPVSILVNNSGLPNQVKDYYIAKFPNLTTENNPVITAKGNICVKLEDDSMETVHLNQLAINEADDDVWFEVQACFPEFTDFIPEGEENNSSEADSVNPLTD